MNHKHQKMALKLDKQDEVPDPEQDDVQAPGGESSEAPGTLTEALQKKGADAVDATPLRGESGANRCPVPECDLPGGHAGHHQDRDGRTFMYDLYEGRRAPTSGEKEADISSSSSSSSSQRSRSASSEELAVEEPGSKKPAREERSRSPRSRKKDEEDTFLVFNLEVDEDDFDWLAKNRHRKRAAVWLSKKMSAKGQEVIWQRLPLKEKQEYDMAMAKEISQVAISRALRNLTDKEAKELDPATLMRMRWVLTRKQDGMAKARLVVLGFMAHNLTEVQTTSPTMSKVGRNVLLGNHCRNEIPPSQRGRDVRFPADWHEPGGREPDGPGSAGASRDVWCGAWRHKSPTGARSFLWACTCSKEVVGEMCCHAGWTRDGRSCLATNASSLSSRRMQWRQIRRS